MLETVRELIVDAPKLFKAAPGKATFGYLCIIPLLLFCAGFLIVFIDGSVEATVRTISGDVYGPMEAPRGFGSVLLALSVMWVPFGGLAVKFLVVGILGAVGGATLGSIETEGDEEGITRPN